DRAVVRAVLLRRRVARVGLRGLHVAAVLGAVSGRLSVRGAVEPAAGAQQHRRGLDVALKVRRLKVMDIPQLEALERERLAAFPQRKGWLQTFHRHVERALSEEPEGFLVAELNDKVVGGAICRQKGPHPLTAEKHGQLLVLTVSALYARHNVAQR